MGRGRNSDRSLSYTLISQWEKMRLYKISGGGIETKNKATMIESEVEEKDTGVGEGRERGVRSQVSGRLEESSWTTTGLGGVDVCCM